MKVYLSTSKKGYGISELLSDDIDHYWSTNSLLPHWILLNNTRIKYIYSVKIYLTYKIDETYTPQEIEYAFNSKSYKITFEKPEGYKELLINDYTDKISIKIVSNHSDGKDSHIRNLKLYESPYEEICLE